MVIGDVVGILGVVSVVVSVAIWVFKRGSDVGVFSTKFSQVSNDVGSLKRRLDSFDKTMRTFMSEDGETLPWKVKKLKEDVHGIMLESKRISDNALEAEKAASVALEAIKELDGENNTDHEKTQKQIIVLARQIRAITDHLNDNIRKGKGG